MGTQGSDQKGSIIFNNGGADTAGPIWYDENSHNFAMDVFATRLRVLRDIGESSPSLLGEFDASGNLFMGGYVSATTGIRVAATLTAAGTTGNQTINKPSGRVNFAAAATSLTVTDSLVTTSSLVLAVLQTNDATARIANVVPASGSFTINLTAAATAETACAFFVVNQ